MIVNPAHVHEFADAQAFVWSQINVDNVARLVSEGRMTAHGLVHVDAAKADGRWQKAYGSGKGMPIPPDLQAAIDAEPLARQMLDQLSAQNRFALVFRVHTMKTAAGRSRKIASLVEMLKRGETIHPQRKKAAADCAAAPHIKSAHFKSQVPG